MDGEKFYLLKIYEGATLVAEAPLIVYDKSATMRNFLETLPSVVSQLQGAAIGMIQLACSEADPPSEVAAIEIKGNHTGLVLTDTLPPSNGHGPNRADRRHPGF